VTDVVPAPVGNRHPGVSHLAADIVTPYTGTHIERLCYILWIAGRRGLPADNAKELYNDFFQPRRKIANDVASRYQTARGESRGAREVYDPPWVEYIDDREPRGLERLSEDDGYLERINVYGNFALCQRVTFAPAVQQVVMGVRDGLIGSYGLEAVLEFEEKIRRSAGVQLRRLVRVGGINGRQERTIRRQASRAVREGR